MLGDSACWVTGEKRAKSQNGQALQTHYDGHLLGSTPQTEWSVLEQASTYSAPLTVLSQVAFFASTNSLLTCLPIVLYFASFVFSTILSHAVGSLYLFYSPFTRHYRLALDLDKFAPCYIKIWKYSRCDDKRVGSHTRFNDHWPVSK